MDDEASSIASFEDVGSAKTAANNMIKDLIVAAEPGITKDFGDDEVPDVLYVVEYRDVGGRLVESRSPPLLLHSSFNSPTY